jgi:hypothetical protein
MIEMLSDLRGTGDLTDWQEGFVENVMERTGGGLRTSHLSEKQVETIEAIWKRHFA